MRQLSLPRTCQQGASRTHAVGKASVHLQEQPSLHWQTADTSSPFPSHPQTPSALHRRSCGSIRLSSWDGVSRNLLLQSPPRTLRSAPPRAPKHSSVTLKKTQPQHQLSPQALMYHQTGPVVLNSYLNSHFEPITTEATALLPPGERTEMFHHYKPTGRHRFWSRGANPTLSPENTWERFINMKNRGQVEIQGATQTQRAVTPLQ